MTGPVVLGLSCFVHDAAACLVRDGQVVAAAQEERFTRRKHDPRFPRHAIAYCLAEAKLGAEDVDIVAFHDHPGRAPDALVQESLPAFRGEVVADRHALSQAASAYLPSPFDTAAILVIDGADAATSTTIAEGLGSTVTPLYETASPHSLGLFYTAATGYLGFKPHGGEYKVMGLAPYGRPVYEKTLRDEVVAVAEDGTITLNPAYAERAAWAGLLGHPRRAPESALDPFHMDVAASVQRITQSTMVRLARHARALTGAPNLAMSGEVALNCVGNGEILRAGLFDRMWIQPAAGGAGAALGAALAAYHRCAPDAPRAAVRGYDRMNGALLGPAYDVAEIVATLDRLGAPFERLEDEELPARVAAMLDAGKVIGLFQGRMEFGPRALGARSIVADARDPDMPRRINGEIKFREPFRPFAPMVLEEKAADWFDIDTPSPYMLLVAPVAGPRQRSTIAAVTHVDYSARIQTVGTETMPRLRRVLEAFEDRTGVPVLVNTSFNLRGEPIVCTPGEAYRCMMRSNIDAIVMENILVERHKQPPWQ